VLKLLDSGAVRRRSRAARGACVVVSGVVRVVCVVFVCVVRACAVRVVGSVSCHVDAAFSRRAARVGADAKDGERCVWCSRMWCWLLGCVHRLDCVCGAVRACQFDWIRVMSRRRGVVEESGACWRRVKDGGRCVCSCRM